MYRPSENHVGSQSTSAAYQRKRNLDRFAEIYFFEYSYFPLPMRWNCDIIREVW